MNFFWTISESQNVDLKPIMKEFIDQLIFPL